MKAKIFCLVLAVLVGITVFTDFRGAAGTGGVSITMLNTKGEIQSELESMAALYESKTGVHINVIPAGSGTSPLANIAAMYSSAIWPTGSRTKYLMRNTARCTLSPWGRRPRD